MLKQMCVCAHKTTILCVRCLGELFSVEDSVVENHCNLGPPTFNHQPGVTWHISRHISQFLLICLSVFLSTFLPLDIGRGELQSSFSTNVPGISHNKACKQQKNASNKNGGIETARRKATRTM